MRRFLGYISYRIYLLAKEYKIFLLKKSYPNVHPSVVLGNVEFVGKNIIIGKGSYINDGGVISSGKTSSVTIGEHCAIGRYVHITAKTHSLVRPTTDEETRILPETEKNTCIGDYVWIGDKVFIKEGINIGSFAIIAANSVVVKDVEPFEIVGGIPARHIRFNDKHYKYKT